MVSDVLVIVLPIVKTTEPYIEFLDIHGLQHNWK